MAMSEKDKKIIEILELIADAISKSEFRGLHVFTINAKINELYELMNKE